MIFSYLILRYDCFQACSSCHQLLIYAVQFFYLFTQPTYPIPFCVSLDSPFFIMQIHFPSIVLEQMNLSRESLLQGLKFLVFAVHLFSFGFPIIKYIANKKELIKISQQQTFVQFIDNISAISPLKQQILFLTDYTLTSILSIQNANFITQDYRSCLKVALTSNFNYDFKSMILNRNDTQGTYDLISTMASHSRDVECGCMVTFLQVNLLQKAQYKLHTIAMIFASSSSSTSFYILKATHFCIIFCIFFQSYQVDREYAKVNSQLSPQFMSVTGFKIRQMVDGQDLFQSRDCFATKSIPFASFPILIAQQHQDVFQMLLWQGQTWLIQYFNFLNILLQLKATSDRQGQLQSLYYGRN